MWSYLRFRFRALFRRGAVEAELDEEVRSHFDKQVEKYVRAGAALQPPFEMRFTPSTPINLFRM